MLNRRRTRAALRQVLLVSLAVSALFAVGAAAAQAEGPFWYTGKTSESLTKLTGSVTALASLGETKFQNGETATRWVMKPGGPNGNLLGVTATGLEFKETVAKNTASYGTVEGKLILTGAKGTQPCDVPGGKLVSNRVYQKPVTINGKTYVEIAPTAGKEAAIWTIQLTNCDFATNFVVKGNIIAEDSSYFETTLSHTLRTSAAIQYGSGVEFKYAGEPGWAEGAIVEHLAEPLYWTLK